MRRVWFKKEMKEAILKEIKTATTRNHPIPLGQVVAVCGSRFKPEPFAILDIQIQIPTFKEHVIYYYYKEEGFKSPEEMIAFAKKEKLLQTDDFVYFHRFKLIKKLEDGEKANE